MSKVLVDNWTLERAAVSINDTYERTSDPNQEYASLVDALILFDDVTYFDTSYSYQ